MDHDFAGDFFIAGVYFLEHVTHKADEVRHSGKVLCSPAHKLVLNHLMGDTFLYTTHVQKEIIYTGTLGRYWTVQPIDMYRAYNCS